MTNRLYLIAGLIAVLVSVSVAVSTPLKPLFRGVKSGSDFKSRSIVSLRPTMRILAIRVDFPRDTISTTTGDGGFDFGNREGRKIDPPPHDSSYFQDQFKFVDHYFRQVSGNRLSMEATVFPSGNRIAYRMSEPIWHYHPDPADNDLTNQRITELWREAWNAAGQDPNVHFYTVSGTDTIPNYDLYVVLHAGSGNEYDLGYDDTPFDIPSGFMTKADYSKYLSITNPRGLPITTSDGGTFYIPEGALLPEMSSQKTGSEWIDIGVGGLYTFLLGRSIGMPFLYDVDKGTSRVGRWSLMDRGFGTFFGILPGYPDAYTRMRMGWVQPVPAPDTGIVELRIPQDTLHPTLPEVMRFEGAGDEYYLMEARNRDPDSVKCAYVYDVAGHRAKLTDQYEIELDTSLANSFGVIVRADNYEFDTPGSGVLVWRVNAAEERRRTALNIPFQTGSIPYVLKLIEADGSEDFGQNYDMFSPGSGTETGSPYDAFFRNNTEWSHANGDDGAVRFSREVNPPAITSNGAPLQFTLGQFSSVGWTMSFRVYRNSNQLEGEKRFRISPSKSPVVAIPFDVNNDRFDEVWIADSNAIYGLTTDGNWIGTDTIRFVTHDQTTGAMLDSIASPALFHFDGPPIRKMVFHNASGSLRILAYRCYADGSGKRLTDYACTLPISGAVSLSQHSIDLPGAVTTLACDETSNQWIVGLSDYAIVRDSIRTNPQLVMTFINRSYHLDILNPSGTDLEFPLPSDLSGNPEIFGLNSTVPLAGVGNRLYRYSGTEWSLDPSFSMVADSIKAIGWTSENAVVITRNQWLLTNGKSLRTGFPRRLPSSSAPISLVAAKTTQTDPVIWYGTETGELWKLYRDRVDRNYPIAIGIQPVDGLVLLTAHHIPTAPDSVRLAAVSRDGVVFLTTLPLSDVEAATWAAPAGTGSGLPNSTPERDWSVMYDNGLSYAFVWPNPIKGNQGFVRVGSNQAGMSQAKAEVFDVIGERIATLHNPYPVEGGGYEWRWDVSSVSRGLYIVRVQVPGAPVKMIKAAVVK